MWQIVVNESREEICIECFRDVCNMLKLLNMMRFGIADEFGSERGLKMWEVIR